MAENEQGQPELAFRTCAMGERFARVALRCAEVYVSGEDRLAMQLLSELLAGAIRAGVLAPGDLNTTEDAVIAKLLADPRLARQWTEYRALHRIYVQPQPGAGGDWRRVPAKKRFIDPLVRGQGRVSALSPDFRAQKEEFLSRSQTEWLHAD